MHNELSERGRIFLRRPLFAVLATRNQDGSIHLCYMWYQLIDDGVDGDCLLLNTTKKRPQYHNILRDPNVSLCIGERYQYVRIKGKCKIIDDRECSLQTIFTLAARYDGQEAAKWFVETTCVKQERVSLYCRVEKVREYWGVDNGRVMQEVRNE